MKFYLLLGFLFYVTSVSTVNAQLSGDYYIDQTATGTDLFLNGGRYFTTFNEVLDTLWSQGVSSAVTFQVAGGQTFNEQL